MGVVASLAGVIVIDYVKSFFNRESSGQFMRMAAIGAINTLVDFGLLNVFFGVLGWGEYSSITVAYVVATFLAYVLNRTFTFGLDASVKVRESVGFLLINLGALGVTNLVVWFASEQLDGLDQLQLNLVKAATTILILLPKFAGYRDLVFRAAREERRAERVESG